MGSLICSEFTFFQSQQELIVRGGQNMRTPPPRGEGKGREKS